MSGSAIRFSEVMSGYVVYGAHDEQSPAAARRHENRMRLRLTVKIDDLDRFTADPGREAAIVGCIE